MSEILLLLFNFWNSFNHRIINASIPAIIDFRTASASHLVILVVILSLEIRTAYVFLVIHRRRELNWLLVHLLSVVKIIIFVLLVVDWWTISLMLILVDKEVVLAVLLVVEPASGAILEQFPRGTLRMWPVLDIHRILINFLFWIIVLTFIHIIRATTIIIILL